MAFAGIGELEVTEWVQAWLPKLGRRFAGWKVHCDASMAAEVMAARHRGLLQVWAPGDWGQPRTGRLSPASDAWLRRNLRGGRLFRQSSEWSVESVNAVWLRFRYSGMPMVVVHDRSLYARRMVDGFARSNRWVVEVDWRKESIRGHRKEGSDG